MTDWRYRHRGPVGVNGGVCRVEDCESAAYCRGRCIAHYNRWPRRQRRAHDGDMAEPEPTPTPAPLPPPPPRRRSWEVPTPTSAGRPSRTTERVEPMPIPQRAAYTDAFTWWPTTTEWYYRAR